jgi:phage head maturation protease
MIEAHFTGQLLVAAATTGGTRTITGVAVPWNTPGRVSSGDTVVFHPGSLDAAGRPVALRDHDRTKPIGKVTDAADTGSALEATVAVSRTRDGDDALVLAADGALPMFSVGVEPTDYRYDADGTLHVHAGEWQELSLLTIGAYPDARVSTVTATQGEPMDTATATAPVEPTEPDDPTEDETEGEETPPVETELAPALVPVTAGRGVLRRPGRHPYAGIGIRDLSAMICAASASGDLDIARRVHQIMTSPGGRAAPSIAAALVDVKLVGTDNVGAMQRPGYQAELVDIVSHGSPIVESLRQGDLQRGDYPNVTFNAWTKTPQVALQSAEKVAINSTPVAIGPTSVPVQTWATGNDLSQQLLDFGSPSFVEDYIRAAGIDYAETIEAYAVTVLKAAATDVTTAAGDGFQAVLGKLFAALDPTKVPAGGMTLAVSWDVWVSMIGIKESDRPAFWDGRISFGEILPMADAGGLSIIVSTQLPARTYLLYMRNAATWYDLPGTPFSLRAINVGQLGLDIAVYGYGACGVQYPFAMVDTTVPLT